jgi:hypothetical protein
VRGLAILILLLGMGTIGEVAPGERARLEAGRFSAGSGLPDGWRPLTFPKIPRHTEYALVHDGETQVLRAESRSAASGLIRELDFDLREYPILRWRWKVENVLPSGDVTRKEGDDYAARVYITFAYEPERYSWRERIAYRLGRALYGGLPGRTLSYIWASRAATGTIHPSPYTDFVRLLVVESGAGRLGRWIEEERDVLEDYRRAFGGEPPRVTGIALMTDTDNTGEHAVAWYGDLTFLAAPD